MAVETGFRRTVVEKTNQVREGYSAGQPCPRWAIQSEIASPWTASVEDFPQNKWTLAGVMRILLAK
jgi:hypothetical protein